MTAGPTLHYSHRNVRRCWLLAVAAFAAACLLWSKIVTGFFWAFEFQSLTSVKPLYLGHLVVSGINIFEYPWQILVLGLLMGILAVVPTLVSQLMSFRYSLPFIAVVLILANLPGFALCLLISCFATACRPLRFRSRFIALVLCTAPQLFYWGYFGSLRGVEPIQWGFSFAPWLSAWLIGLAIAGAVLGIGHFTRYRPGLVWVATGLVLGLAWLIFETKIGFAELDYQLYVAENNPEQVSEYRDHSITEALDQTLNNTAVRKYLRDFFYPNESILLRAELKHDIQKQLRLDRWPSWFIVPPELKYQDKRQWLFNQYDRFIKHRPQSRRMPVAMYYKALLSEYDPDLRLIVQKEQLHFYNDYPHDRAREIWYRLYKEFGHSPESLEARWRIAKHWSAQGKFAQADTLLAEAQTQLRKQIRSLRENRAAARGLFDVFHPPARTAMTELKLSKLQVKLTHLRSLISLENRTDEPASAGRLAGFVMLNPHSLDYEQQLDELLEQMEPEDPLRDNVLLAQAKLIADSRRQSEKLRQLHKQFQKTDGGMQALYELARLKVRLWQQGGAGLESRNNYLVEARAALSSFIELYPTSILADQAKETLHNLPTVE